MYDQKSIERKKTMAGFSRKLVKQSEEIKRLREDLVRQAVREIQQAYDSFEKVAKQTLHEEFGFGDKRVARFEERFSELAAQECLRIEAEMRRSNK